MAADYRMNRIERYRTMKLIAALLIVLPLVIGDHAGARPKEQNDPALRPAMLPVYGIQRLADTKRAEKTKPLLRARTWEGVKAIFQ